MTLEQAIPLLKEKRYTITEYRELDHTLTQLSVYASAIVMYDYIDTIKELLGDSFRVVGLTNTEEIYITINQ